MNNPFHIRILRLISIFVLLVGAKSTLAAGLMTPADGSLPKLAIKEHHVNVVIEDGYAITSVEQVFYNPNSTDLEAIYSFPVPETASVGEFTYWIDGKPVTGEVLEKQEARQIYEKEKNAGRETAITEQDGYKTFDTSVYPVRSQQDVRIKLVYIQPAHVDTGIGRYVYPLEEGGVDEEKLAFWTYIDKVTEAFSFELKLRSSYPIDNVRLPNHAQPNVTPLSDQEWSVSLANQTAIATTEETAADTISTDTQLVQRLDKDIVVYWRHQQGLPGSVDMIAHKEDPNARGTFMMTVTPGEDLSAISQGRDWVFVLDLSGSMHGKYQSLLEGVKKGLGKLDPNDRFRVVLFNDHARELTNGYTPATREHIEQTIQELEHTSPSSSTNLYAGLEKGIKGLDADRSSAVILVTDGVANVGVTEKRGFLKLLEKYDVRLFTFVMGGVISI